MFPLKVQQGGGGREKGADHLIMNSHKNESYQPSVASLNVMIRLLVMAVAMLSWNTSHAKTSIIGNSGSAETRE